jgi:hypothetical protein
MESKVIIGKNPRLKVKVSDRYSRDELLSIAQDIRDYIALRTEKGLGKNQKPWSGKAATYSETYANSLDFKIAGKSKNNVNLTLSSEMLGSLNPSVKGSEITIDLEGEDNKAKAEGNIKGTYGKKSPIPGKARNFLDLAPGELRAILANYPLRGEGAAQKRRENVQTSRDSGASARSIVAELLEDDEA